MAPTRLGKSAALLLWMPIALSAASASAHAAHRLAPRRHHGGAAIVPAPPPALSSAQIIDRAAARQRAAPGVTRAIDLGAAPTATGGPVGGLPGNSGGP